MTNAEVLQRWMDDAHYAVTLGHALSVPMCKALEATPEFPSDTATARTWHLEQYERLMRAQLRDPVPMGGTAEEVEEWRDRQQRRGNDLAELLDRHAECVTLARAFVTDSAHRIVKAKTRKPRRTVTAHALAMVSGAA